MDIILIILERIFSVTFIQKAVTQGVHAFGPFR